MRTCVIDIQKFICLHSWIYRGTIKTKIRGICNASCMLVHIKQSFFLVFLLLLKILIGVSVRQWHAMRLSYQWQLEINRCNWWLRIFFICHKERRDNVSEKQIENSFYNIAKKKNTFNNVNIFFKTVIWMSYLIQCTTSCIQLRAESRWSIIVEAIFCQMLLCPKWLSLLYGLTNNFLENYFTAGRSISKGRCISIEYRSISSKKYCTYIVYVINKKTMIIILK